MCGIAGFFGEYSPALLECMGGAMASRGPDDVGAFEDMKNKVGLVHRRLSVIDTSAAGHQPMLDNESRVALVFNGEIYNYQSLKKELEVQGYCFTGGSDTEVLLKGYLAFGEGVLDRLNGIFAFAIWDKRNESLFVARDHLGVKPFYYSLTSEGFLFASELKSLLSFKGLSKDLDFGAIYNHLTFLYSPGSKTLLKAVKKLEPGYALRIKKGKIVAHWRFYDLPYGQAKDNSNASSFSKSVADALRSSVNSQLVSDVPVGAFLSGGLDSSAIVALAKDSHPDLDLQCYTIRLNASEMYSEGFVDDLPFAQKVAKHCRVPLNIVDVDSAQIFSLAKMIYHLDEPQADLAPLNVLAISELARSQGIKVLLSGAGGDDVFTGYRRHFALQSERYWAFLPKEIRSILKNISSAFPSSIPLIRRVKKAFEYADLNSHERIASYFSWLHPSRGLALFSDEVKSSLQDYSPFQNLVYDLRELSSNVSRLDKMLYLEAKHFLADHNLNYTDKMGMAAGVEIRVPFLDKSLIDVASKIPDEYKQRGREGKWILKKAMEPYLPKEIIYRSKTGFGSPLRFWMKNQLKALTDELLSEASLRKRGVFNAQSVRKLIDDDRTGRQDYSYPILSLVCIELWFRMFLDPETPEIIVL